MQIKGYAPEAGPHTDSTRVILVLDEMSRARVRGKFYAIFDGNEIEAKVRQRSNSFDTCHGN
jgi:hypothetical protein